MKKLLLIALLLTGCGPGPGPELCDIEGLLFTNQPRHACEALSENVGLARYYLTRGGVLENGEFDQLLGGTRVLVREDRSWVMEDGDRVVGVHFPAAPEGAYDIELGRTTTAMLHELLHRVEWERTHTSSANHAGWEERGWFKLDDDYAWNCKSL